MTVTSKYSVRKNFEVDNLMLKIVTKSNEQFEGDISKAFADGFYKHLKIPNIKAKMERYCRNHRISINVPQKRKKDF